MAQVGANTRVARKARHCGGMRPNPSLERGPPPAQRREALTVYDAPRGAVPAASAQLKR